MVAYIVPCKELIVFIVDNRILDFNSYLYKNSNFLSIKRRYGGIDVTWLACKTVETKKQSFFGSAKYLQTSWRRGSNPRCRPFFVLLDLNLFRSVSEAPKTFFGFLSANPRCRPFFVLFFQNIYNNIIQRCFYET